MMRLWSYWLSGALLLEMYKHSPEITRHHFRTLSTLRTHKQFLQDSESAMILHLTIFSLYLFTLYLEHFPVGLFDVKEIFPMITAGGVTVNSSVLTQEYPDK